MCILIAKIRNLSEVTTISLYFYGFFEKKLQKVLEIQEKVVPLHPQSRKRQLDAKELGYGVMVTLQILVLPFLVRVRVPQPKDGCAKAHPFFCYIRLSRHGPAIEQGYPIQSFRTTFLDAHRGTQLHPAGWHIRGDAQGLVRSDAREPAYILDVPLGVVLIWRRPAIDYRPDGIKAVRVVIRARQHHERCTPAIRHGFKLTELSICLQGLHALPLIL